MQVMRGVCVLLGVLHKHLGAVWAQDQTHGQPCLLGTPSAIDAVQQDQGLQVVGS